eukprot:scaffold31909_cov35-Prasinocladus_malaysianus.AAC.1
MDCCELFPPAHIFSPTFGPVGIWGHCTTFALYMNGMGSQKPQSHSGCHVIMIAMFYRGRRSHHMLHALVSIVNVLSDHDVASTAQGVQRGWNSPEKLYQAPDYQRPQPPSAVSPKVKSTKPYIGRNGEGLTPRTPRHERYRPSPRYTSAIQGSPPPGSPSRPGSAPAGSPSAHRGQTFWTDQTGEQAEPLSEEEIKAAQAI